MKNRGKSVKMLVSLSGQLRARVKAFADEEFAGNVSAFIAHVVLHYEKCGSCQYLKDSVINNISIDGNNSAPISQSKKSESASK